MNVIHTNYQYESPMKCVMNIQRLRRHESKKSLVVIWSTQETPTAEVDPVFGEVKECNIHVVPRLIQGPEVHNFNHQCHSSSWLFLKSRIGGRFHSVCDILHLILKQRKRSVALNCVEFKIKIFGQLYCKSEITHQFSIEARPPENSQI